MLTSEATTLLKLINEQLTLLAAEQKSLNAKSTGIFFKEAQKQKQLAAGEKVLDHFRQVRGEIEAETFMKTRSTFMENSANNLLRRLVLIAYSQAYITERQPHKKAKDSHSPVLNVWETIFSRFESLPLVTEEKVDEVEAVEVKKPADEKAEAKAPAGSGNALFIGSQEDRLRSKDSREAIIFSSIPADDERSSKEVVSHLVNQAKIALGLGEAGKQQFVNTVKLLFRMGPEAIGFWNANVSATRIHASEEVLLIPGDSDLVKKKTEKIIEAFYTVVASVMQKAKKEAGPPPEVKASHNPS